MTAWARKDLLGIAGLAPAEILEILETAATMKDISTREIKKVPVLRGKTVVNLFFEASTRTRVSLEVGMWQLGGYALYLSAGDLQLGRGEAIGDTAQVLSRYVDGIMARVFSHKTILELVKHSRVPVINGLSDYSHPCQGLADLFTIYEKKGCLAGLKVAYVGDGNNVAYSLLYGCSKLGANIVVASPKGYEPKEEVVSRAAEEARKNGCTVTVTNDPKKAVKGADVVYTDVWTSMGLARLFNPLPKPSTVTVRPSGPWVRVSEMLPAAAGLAARPAEDGRVTIPALGTRTVRVERR